MSKVISLEITADASVMMLNDDSIDLTEFGSDLNVTRASHVEYDNTKQCWYVVSAKTGKVLKTDCKTRGEALSWEKQYYSPNGPGWAELKTA